MVAYVLGALHPEHCAAVHSNITVCLPSMTNPWTMLQVRSTRARPAYTNLQGCKI